MKGGQGDHERSLLRNVSYTGSTGVSGRSRKSHGELYRPALSGPCPCYSRISSIVPHINESAQLLLHLPEETMPGTDWRSKTDDQLQDFREKSDEMVEGLREKARKDKGRYLGYALRDLQAAEEVQSNLSEELARRLRGKSDADNSQVCGWLT